MSTTKAFFHSWLDKIKINSNPNWQTIHNSICNQLYFNEDYLGANCAKIKGDIFEYLCKYIYEFKKYTTYLNNEIPESLMTKLQLPNTDKGIDIIISKDKKNWIGVQCKWRAKYNRVNKPEYVAKFKDQIERSNLQYGIFFTNSNKVHPDYSNICHIKWYTYSQLIEDVNKVLFQYIKSIKEDKIKYQDKHQSIINELRYYTLMFVLIFNLIFFY
jgi:predicted helicase